LGQLERSGSSHSARRSALPPAPTGARDRSGKRRRRRPAVAVTAGHPVANHPSSEKGDGELSARSSRQVGSQRSGNHSSRIAAARPMLHHWRGDVPE
jgi:hypothetical protein